MKIARYVKPVKLSSFHLGFFISMLLLLVGNTPIASAYSNSPNDTSHCFGHQCDGKPLTSYPNCQDANAYYLKPAATISTVERIGPWPITSPLGSIEHWISPNCQAQWVHVQVYPWVQAQNIEAILLSGKSSRSLLEDTGMMANVASTTTSLWGYQPGEKIIYQAGGSIEVQGQSFGTSSSQTFNPG